MDRRIVPYNSELYSKGTLKRGVQMETNNFEEALLYFDHNAKYAYRYINTFIVSPNFYEQVVSKFPQCNVYRFVISEGFTQMYGISFLQDGEVPIGYNAYLLNLKH